MMQRPWISCIFFLLGKAWIGVVLDVADCRQFAGLES